MQTLYRTFNRYRTLHTHRITDLPIVILMPHSACNCRCVICDIWKGNQRLKQLSETDVEQIMSTLAKMGTRQVLMSGGEALLNPNFFRLCEILKRREIKISLLSTGLTIKKHAAQLVKWVNDVVVSLDGDEALHDAIRNVAGAFARMRQGIEALREIDPHYQVTGRCVIHRLNFRSWPAIIDTARALGLDRISFLPADVSSSAFNREMPWTQARQNEILLSEDDLTEMKCLVDHIINRYAEDFLSGFIAETPSKLAKIYNYYAAYYGRHPFPYKKCNAPWVSAVIEADGAVKPCFFHAAYGNIHHTPLEQILNSQDAIAFRKNLDMDNNDTCRKCVCYLHLSPFNSIS